MTENSGYQWPPHPVSKKDANKAISALEEEIVKGLHPSELAHLSQYSTKSKELRNIMDTSGGKDTVQYYQYVGNKKYVRFILKKYPLISHKRLTISADHTNRCINQLQEKYRECLASMQICMKIERLESMAGLVEAADKNFGRIENTKKCRDHVSYRMSEYKNEYIQMISGLMKVDELPKRNNNEETEEEGSEVYLEACRSIIDEFTKIVPHDEIREVKKFKAMHVVIDEYLIPRISLHKEYDIPYGNSRYYKWDELRNNDTLECSAILDSLCPRYRRAIANHLETKILKKEDKYKKICIEIYNNKKDDIQKIAKAIRDGRIEELNSQ